MSDTARIVVPTYTSTLSRLEIEFIRQWHEQAYASLCERTTDEEVEYLGLRLTVPPEVFPPTPMSDLLGRAVLAEVRESDRVLDMGTGCGANAILAASRSRAVVAVDINPHALECAGANATRARVEDRIDIRHSDVFEDVEGTFDLMIIDPPFRWFAPRDVLEAAITDEDYRALRRFMAEAPSRLNRGGRVLISFGSSGDIDYLESLVDLVGLSKDRVAQRELERDGSVVRYVVWRLQRRG